MKTASAKMENARISLKHSLVILEEIKGKRLAAAKRLLENLIDKKISLKKKYHPTAAKQILEILGSAEANAKQKTMDDAKLFVAIAKADKGRTFMRPRTHGKLRGEEARSSNIEIVLEER